MEYREQVLNLARQQPILPTAVAKALNTNTILAGAILSELCSKGHLKASTIKVGGSPLYYIPGNEHQLLNHTNNLNEKDRRTVDKLKEAKIIRESDTDPLTRVSLSQIKDFAYPLIVQYDGKEERFYKWFALDDKEAENRIREILEPKQTTQEPTIKEAPEAPEPQPKQPLTQTEQPKEKNEPKTEQPKPSPKPKEKPKQPTTTFWDDVHAFLTKNNITLEEKQTNRKNDYDLIITVPSAMGNLTYYCKAKRKKRITDADLSNAYVHGQVKKLPVIYLTDGELTKKAKDIKNQLKGLTVTTL